MKLINLLITLVLIALVSLTAPAATVRLMTYNIRLDVASDKENAWPNRRDFLAGQVRFTTPDIFGVQEALPNQIDDLSRAFPEYDRIGIGRDGDGKGEASSIFFNKTRFRVTSATTFWLSETPDVISKGWDAALNRICTYGLFTDRRTKRKFWVFNTHFDHVGQVARRKSAELILARIKEVNKKNLPVFLMGDFNADPASEPYKVIAGVMKDTRAVSVEAPFGPRGTFNGFRYDSPVTNLIDHIFISDSALITVKKYAVLSDSIDKRFPSDHFPVVIDAEIR